jgi:hypothetical protein
MRRHAHHHHTAQWAIRSEFVPRRDGPLRLEQAFRILLASVTQEDSISHHHDGSPRHESGPLCPRLDEQAES